MDRLQFYKEMYFHENAIKHKLDDKISMPTAMLTVIVSVHAYIFGKDIHGLTFDLIKIVSVFAGSALVFCLFYMAKSMFNLGATRAYRELNQMNEYRNYDLQLKQHNQEHKYSEHLEAQFAEGASINARINISRTEAMAKCKRSLFFCLIFTFINGLLFVNYTAHP